MAPRVLILSVLVEGDEVAPETLNVQLDDAEATERWKRRAAMRAAGLGASRSLSHSRRSGVELDVAREYQQKAPVPVELSEAAPGQKPQLQSGAVSG